MVSIAKSIVEQEEQQQQNQVKLGSVEEGQEHELGPSFSPPAVENES